MALYKTVRKEAEAFQIIEKSKFTAHVKPVSTKEEAETFIAETRKRYKDATHNVPAIVIGDKFQIQWASDDGEPQGTSGAPMVQMMVKEGITNVAVVVTRYFGGIKLGTGGLVRAYTSSAKLGLEEAGICSVEEICKSVIKVDYSYLSKIQNLASDFLDLENNGSETQFTIGEIEYLEKVSIQVLTLPQNTVNIDKVFADITSGTFEVMSRETILEKV